MGAPTLDSLLSPAHSAVVTMECQSGVVGNTANLPMLRDAAMQKGSLAAAAAICAAARKAGVKVVHATAENYPSGVGGSRNCRLLAAGEEWMQKDDPSTDIIDELQLAPEDMVVPRAHGVSPFMSTSLDQILRNMGIQTIVAVGHSLNVGLTGLVINAVDLGYQVVVPEDAVVGIPVEYGEEVIKNTLFYLATITKSDEVVKIWG